MSTHILTPEIRICPEKKLIGMHIPISIANNHTFELWRGFMPRRKEITNAIGTDLYSLQVYDTTLHINSFSLDTVFEKWAAIEVTDFDNAPEGMEPCTLAGGLYAVFVYKGNPNEFEATFRYIFYEWLPASAYILDNTRAHFEILGPKYINNSPDSEEEVWVPVNARG